MYIKAFRFNLQELGGALGDLGALLPLAIALITLNRMNATSVFLIVGLAYIISGLYYRLPMPVQPLKTVAAIAIASSLSPNIISAAGLIMAVFLFLMAATGAITKIAGLFPKMIIRGIQLGVGLLLIRAGLFLINKNEVVIQGDEGFVTLVNLAIPAGWLIAIALGIVFVLSLRSERFPGSLVLLALGIPVSMFWGSSLGLSSLHFGLNLPTLVIPSLSDLSAALVLLVIPQIPLTLGNAVFATADTAKEYYGTQAERVTLKSLLTTMGLVNMGAGLFNGMPICHGAGGLTAHYRLGARTGGAALLIGIPLLLISVVFDGNVVPIFTLIPYAVLGVLVIFVGLQHSFLVRDLQSPKEVIIALAVAIPGLLTKSLAIGLASGISLYLLLNAPSIKRSIVSKYSSLAGQRLSSMQETHK